MDEQHRMQDILDSSQSSDPFLGSEEAGIGGVFFFFSTNSATSSNDNNRNPVGQLFGIVLKNHLPLDFDHQQLSTQYLAASAPYNTFNPHDAASVYSSLGYVGGQNSLAPNQSDHQFYGQSQISDNFQYPGPAIAPGALSPQDIGPTPWAASNINQYSTYTDSSPGYVGQNGPALNHSGTRFYNQSQTFNNFQFPGPAISPSVFPPQDMGPTPWAASNANQYPTFIPGASDYNAQFHAQGQTSDPFQMLAMNPTFSALGTAPAALPASASPPISTHRPTRARATRTQCPNCTQSFARATDLPRHQNSVHGQAARAHLCPIAGCRYSQGRGYSRADKVIEHLWKKHGNLGYVRRA